MSPRQLIPDAVNLLTIDADEAGQRLDHFLARLAPAVPRAHLLRLLRSGQVRLDGARCQPGTRLPAGGLLRLPPLRLPPPRRPRPPPPPADLPVIWEDEHLLVVDKPSGLACHGGSGVSFGLIERLRAQRPEGSFLELAHRLDRDTSGLLALAKSRRALVRLHEAQRDSAVVKEYLLAVRGDWADERRRVSLPLLRYELPSGERRVRVDREAGRPALTVFTLERRYGPLTLLRARLLTGRTHQIRVHAAALGFPLLGDEKYGDYGYNAELAAGALGAPLRRLFLHAARLVLTHPVSGRELALTAPTPPELERFLTALEPAEGEP